MGLNRKIFFLHICKLLMYMYVLVLRIFFYDFQFRFKCPRLWNALFYILKKDIGTILNDFKNWIFTKTYILDNILQLNFYNYLGYQINIYF